MRKKWKQGMAAALSALMLLGLAGCGDNGDAGQASGGGRIEAFDRGIQPGVRRGRAGGQRTG